MRNIQKCSEPKILAEHRCHENACYENMSKNVRERLIYQLLEEQGYLCAYCMGRIDSSTMKVEHVASRHEHPEMQLTYSNLVACCRGNESHENKKYSRKEQHCDTYKGDKSLSKNPAIPGDRTEESIQYDSQGNISSKDNVFNKELNDTLNLNIVKLCNNRKAVRQGVMEQLSNLPTNAGKNTIQNLLKKWKERDCNNKFKPYAGVAIYFLKRRLKYTN